MKSTLVLAFLMASVHSVTFKHIKDIGKDEFGKLDSQKSYDMYVHQEHVVAKLKKHLEDAEKQAAEEKKKAMKEKSVR